MLIDSLVNADISGYCRWQLKIGQGFGCGQTHFVMSADRVDELVELSLTNQVANCRTR